MARFRVLPIIATLGIMNIVRGVTYIESKGAWVSSYQMSDGFKAISTGTVLGVNNLVLIAVVIFVAVLVLREPHQDRPQDLRDRLQPRGRRHLGHPAGASSSGSSTRPWASSRGSPACSG